MKSFKLYLGVFVVLAIVYAGWQILPHYFNNYQFADAVEQEAIRSSYSNRSAEEIRDLIYAKAQELALPLTREQIQVTRNGREVRIIAPYRVIVNLPGYALELKFDPSTRNRAI